MPDKKDEKFSYEDLGAELSPVCVMYADIECFTKSGPETGKPCAFPFIYKENTYETCTEIDHHQFWCSIEVDYNGNHVRGKWGNCGNECDSLGKVFIFL